MGCARMYTKHPRQLAATAHTAINALRRKRHLTGGGPSLASRSPLRRLPLKPRWRPKKQSKFTVSDQRLLSSRTPGSKSDVDFDNFDAADEKRHPWKLLGPASVTTSSGGSAYGASSMPQLPPRDFFRARRFKCADWAHLKPKVTPSCL